MSEEDKELLARIGQLAGQINRHKNQQLGTNATPSRHAPHYRRLLSSTKIARTTGSSSIDNTYRHASAPYPTRGHRVQRPRPHQHRTLNFNASESSTPSSSGWVTRNDRHRQLINANVYEKQIQSRSKAIEETRKKTELAKRRGEKKRLNDFLKHQQHVSGTSSTANATSVQNEIVIQGIRFRVLDGGKKLSRLPGEDSGRKEGPEPQLTVVGEPISLSDTPKTTVIAGVKFHRTKTGNFVVNRVVKDHRRSAPVKKTDEPCKIFSSTGSCPKGPQCRYIHDPSKVALCKDFLKKEGKCALGESCDLSHDMTPERVPNCLHYAKGNCAKAECPFTHSKASPSAPVCRAFGFRGYCEKGADCTERHVFECPDFSNTGKCNIKGCKLLHRERASVLRHQQNSEETMEDLSSDDDAGDSDDVDSDAVAEFIDADSDASDIEDRQDFIPL